MSLTKVTKRMIDGDTVSVLDYGAVGDDSTDNTAAFQAAIDFVYANGGGTVYVPTGIYVLDGIAILKSNVRITGEGAGSTLKKTGASPSNVRTLYFGSGSNTNVEIDHLRFYSDRTEVNRPASVIDAGLGSADFDNIHIHDNIFDGSNDGCVKMLFSIGSSNTLNNVRVINNTFNDAKYNCIEYNNHNSDTVERGKNFQISGNTFNGWGLLCITLSGPLRTVNISNNNFTNPSGTTSDHAIEFVGGINGGLIEGNVFSGTMGNVLYSSGSAPYPASRNTTVKGNVIAANTTNSFNIQSQQDMLIDGNHFYGSGALNFSGVNLGCNAFVSNNWLSASVITSNGAVVKQYNNYIGTYEPRNLPINQTITLSGGDTTSTAVITPNFSSSWRTTVIEVTVSQVKAGGSGQAIVKSLINMRALNSSTTPISTQDDIVTSAGLTLSRTTNANGTLTITATSTTADVQQAWHIEMYGYYGERGGFTTVTISA